MEGVITACRKGLFGTKGNLRDASGKPWAFGRRTKLEGGPFSAGQAVEFALSEEDGTIVWIRPLRALDALHTLRTALGSSLVVAGLFEMAAGRFKYLVVYLPIVLFETGALVVLTGWGAVEPYAPQWMTDAVAALAPARLSFFVKWLFASAVLQAAALAAFFAVRAIRSRQRRQAVYPTPTTTSTSTSTPSRKARQP